MQGLSENDDYAPKNVPQVVSQAPNKNLKSSLKVRTFLSCLMAQNWCVYNVYTLLFFAPENRGGKVNFTGVQFTLQRALKASSTSVALE